MPRYRLLVEYDGRPYSGFQAQATLPSVQGAIEAAVKAFCGEEVRIAAAGRTDPGVPAPGRPTRARRAGGSRRGPGRPGRGGRPRGRGRAASR